MRPLPLFSIFCKVVAPLGLLLLLWSCEEPVDLGIEAVKSRLVINANIFPGEPVSLRVSATRPPGTPARAIEDAQVALFEGSELVEELTFIPGPEGRDGTYRTKRYLPRVGRQYTIHVAASGYDPVTAVSSIPLPVAIDSLGITDLIVRQEEGYTLYDYVLSVNYRDPVDTINYYDLRIWQRVVPFSVTARGDTTTGRPVLKSIELPSAVGTVSRPFSLLIQDRGSSMPLQLRLSSRLKTDRELLGGIVAELRTVSREYYFYQRSLRADDTTAGGGLDEPVILFDNVDSGLGIFAGYNSTQNSLHFDRH